MSVPARGWDVASAMLEPWMTMKSAFCRSCWKVVAPLPNGVPKLGTVEECHMRAWFSTDTAPSAVHRFFIK